MLSGYALKDYDIISEGITACASTGQGQLGPRRSPLPPGWRCWRRFASLRGRECTSERPRFLQKRLPCPGFFAAQREVICSLTLIPRVVCCSTQRGGSSCSGPGCVRCFCTRCERVPWMVGSDACTEKRRGCLSGQPQSCQQVGRSCTWETRADWGLTWARRHRVSPCGGECRWYPDLLGSSREFVESPWSGACIPQPFHLWFAWK